jgi:Na+/glutamate symporter
VEVFIYLLILSSLSIELTMVGLLASRVSLAGGFGFMAAGTYICLLAHFILAL